MATPQSDPTAVNATVDRDSKISIRRDHILVCGGTGYIGSHTVVELLERGFRVTIVDNLCNSSRLVLDRIQKITGVRPLFAFVDLCDFTNLEAAFERVHKAEDHFDAVIHFAGLKSVGESVERPLLYYRNNLIGTLNLLKIMNKYGCKRMLFSSSATVYGSPKVLPIREDSQLSTTNPYGSTKLMIEDMLRDVAKGASGEEWKIVLLRYFNPIGAHSSGLIGEDPRGVPNNLMPYIAQVAVGRRPHVTIFGNDWNTADGTGVRDYIHVTDLSKGHVAALQQGLFGQALGNSNCKAYNLGTGKGVSVLQMIEAMRSATGKEIKYVIGPRRAGDIAACYADSSKANRELKWKARLSLKRMCEDTWRWQSMYPNGFSSVQKKDRELVENKQ